MTDEMLSTPEEHAELRARNAQQFAALDESTQRTLTRLAGLVAEIQAGTYAQDELDPSVRRARQFGALQTWAEQVLMCFALDDQPEEPGQ